MGEVRTFVAACGRRLREDAGGQLMAVLIIGAAGLFGLLELHWSAVVVTSGALIIQYLGMRIGRPRRQVAAAANMATATTRAGTWKGAGCPCRGSMRPPPARITSPCGAGAG